MEPARTALDETGGKEISMGVKTVRVQDKSIVATKQSATPTQLTDGEGRAVNEPNHEPIIEMGITKNRSNVTPAPLTTHTSTNGKVSTSMHGMQKDQAINEVGTPTTVQEGVQRNKRAQPKPSDLHMKNSLADRDGRTKNTVNAHMNESNLESPVVSLEYEAAIG
ncbi:unnamed protein product [Linum trigynum]|uniref:Uncharacterized protein n=1 Tax=Linum trigynum TaxID=586398 RepID=A0AAV2CGS5_9ROSI